MRLFALQAQERRHAPGAEGAVPLLKGKDDLTLYQWNTRVAEHYFCKHCGIYTHHQPRTRPDTIAVNVGCIDDVSARKLEITFAEGSKLSGGR